MALALPLPSGLRSPPSTIGFLTVSVLTPILPLPWCGETSALSDLPLYLTQHFRPRLTHRPDDGGSKNF
jgi:hypothetical protein